MLEFTRTGQVTGYCAIIDCADFSRTMPVAYERLSDDCPVLVVVQQAERD